MGDLAMAAGEFLGLHPVAGFDRISERADVAADARFYVVGGIPAQWCQFAPSRSGGAVRGETSLAHLRLGAERRVSVDVQPSGRVE